MAKHKLYISFGQTHVHRVDGKTFDRNCLCLVEGEDYTDCRKQAFDAFSGRFAFDYKENQLDYILHHFPRDIIPLVGRV